MSEQSPEPVLVTPLPPAGWAPDQALSGTFREASQEPVQPNG